MSGRSTSDLFERPPRHFSTTVLRQEASRERASSERRNGKVLTFYSFKGGVGRSMALANIAVLIAAQGYRVLMVDFDLEAPGLEHFFSEADPSLSARLQKQPGLIDLLQPEPFDWRECVLQVDLATDLLRTLSASAEFDAAECRVDFLHSGKASRDNDVYSDQVQSLNWGVLYREFGIGNRFGEIRADWIAEDGYDFVLIDSRTGVTDSSDLCTVVLPDHLVMLFVTNQQNIDGIGNVYRRAVEGHSQIPIERAKLTVLPVLSRDEFYSEYEKSSEWRERAATQLAELFADWLPGSVTPLAALQKIFIPYFAIWSFGEALPVAKRAGEISNPGSVSAAYSRIARLITSDLDWTSMDALADPADIAQTRISQQKEFEQQQASLHAEIEKQRFELNAKASRSWRAVGIGVAVTLAAIVGGSYYIYSTSLASERSEQLAMIEEARQAQLTAEAALKAAREQTETQLVKLQASLDEKNAGLEAERKGLLEQIANARKRQDDLTNEVSRLTAHSTELVSAKESLAESRQRVASLELQLQTLRGKEDNALNRCQAELAKHDKSAAALKARLENALSTSEKNLNSLNRCLDALPAVRKKLGKKVK